MRETTREELSLLSLPDLADRLADLHDRPAPAAWSVEDALERAAIERCVIERLTAPVAVGAAPAPELRCSVPVRMRTGALAAAGRIRALVPGALKIDSGRTWPRGASVEVQLRPGGAAPGPSLRGMVVRVCASTFVVALPLATDEATDHRVRRFLLETIRPRVDC